MFNAQTSVQKTWARYQKAEDIQRYNFNDPHIQKECNLIYCDLTFFVCLRSARGHRRHVSWCYLKIAPMQGNLSLGCGEGLS